MAGQIPCIHVVRIDALGMRIYSGRAEWKSMGYDIVLAFQEPTMNSDSLLLSLIIGCQRCLSNFCTALENTEVMAVLSPIIVIGCYWLLPDHLELIREKSRAGIAA